MKKKPFQEQLSKFSLIGQLPKVETGLEEAWKNLKKSTEPFTAQDIIKQQQNCDYCIHQAKAEAVKEFAERLKEDLRTGEPIRDYALRDVIDNLVKEMVGESK